MMAQVHGISDEGAGNLNPRLAHGPVRAQSSARFRTLQTWRVSPLAALGAVICVAAWLRLGWIDSSSFWRNELFSIFWAKRSVAFLWSEGMRLETNPPLYFTLLKAWTVIFGDSVVSARSLSAVAGIFCIPLIYMLGRDINGTATGLVAASVLAVAPPQIYFANEVRCYALMPAIFAAALLLLFRLTRQQNLNVKYLAGYVVCGTALVYLHVSSIFLLASVFLALALHAVDTRLPRRPFVALLCAHGIILLLALPEVLNAFAQRGSPNIEWIPPVGPVTLASMVRFPLLGPYPHWEYASFDYTPAIWAEAALAMTVFAAVVHCALRNSGCRQHVILLAAIPAMFFGAIVAISLARPMMLPRIMICTSVPFALLAGLGICGRGPLPLRVALAGAVLCASAIGFHETKLNPAASKPDWQALLPDLAMQAAPGDVVAVGRHASLLGLAHPPINSLCGRLTVRRWQIHEEPATAFSMLEESVCGHGTTDTDGLASEIGRGTGVWLLLDADDARRWEAERQDARVPPPTIRRTVPGLTLIGWMRGR